MELLPSFGILAIRSLLVNLDSPMKIHLLKGNPFLLYSLVATQRLEFLFICFLGKDLTSDRED